MRSWDSQLARYLTLPMLLAQVRAIVLCASAGRMTFRVISLLLLPVNRVLSSLASVILLNPQTMTPAAANNQLRRTIFHFSTFQLHFSTSSSSSYSNTRLALIKSGASKEQSVNLKWAEWLTLVNVLLVQKRRTMKREREKKKETRSANSRRSTCSNA